jgi:D-alanyl-D-alanine carboxypeptidase
MSRRLIGAILVTALLGLAGAAPLSAAAKAPLVDARAWALIDARTGDVLTSSEKRFVRQMNLRAGERIARRLG